jgi:isochorismate synthase
VNLRCAKIFKNNIIAFAGGGITIMSNPEKEWQETELKSQAILNHLKF